LSLPDSGTGLAERWATHGTLDGSWAADTYAGLFDRAGPAGERHVTTLSLSLDMKMAVRQIRTAGGGIRGAVAGAAVHRHPAIVLADLHPDAAAHDIRKKEVEHISDQAQRTKVGQVEDAS